MRDAGYKPGTSREWRTTPLRRCLRTNSITGTCGVGPEGTPCGYERHIAKKELKHGCPPGGAERSSQRVPPGRSYAQEAPATAPKGELIVYFFIEPMRESDVPRVQEIERQSFSTPWSSATYLRELRSPTECRYVVARNSTNGPPRHAAVDATPRRGWLASLLPAFFPSPPSASPYPVVGYGGVWLTVDEGHITTIATAPEMRGHGIGELVLNGLIDAARDLGAQVLTLEVRVSNNVAQNLYLKYGFEPRGTRRRYYTDNNEDALIMWTGPILAPDYQHRLHELRTQLAERLRTESERYSAT